MRRRELRAEYADAPVSLALYLGGYLVQAAEDMPWAPAGALHRRLVGWTRQPPKLPERRSATVPAEPGRAGRHQTR
ncbi:hypothetical protein [Micromonospora sp. C95]|uniref:hypothetical protein n=1 Tax=Micromonospora sp. C95 TaxID=2824882 RepID=UPI0026574187|nr:hypothetical protein [Micromonospora sp. C95]